MATKSAVKVSPLKMVEYKGNMNGGSAPKMAAPKAAKVMKSVARKGGCSCGR